MTVREPIDREEQDAAGIHIPCPHCSEPQAVCPVTTLRPGDAALTDLFQGSLNRVTCTSCSARFLLDVPMVFRDDERRFLVYLANVEESDAWKDAEAKMRSLNDRIFAADDMAPECRLTISRKAFIEKISLHLSDLDDRIVEYVKYQMYRRPGSEINPVRHELLYDFSTDGEDILGFVVFDRESGRATAGAHIPMDVYRELAGMFLEDDGMRGELDSLFPGHYVSVERLL